MHTRGSTPPSPVPAGNNLIAGLRQGLAVGAALIVLAVPVAIAYRAPVTSTLAETLEPSPLPPPVHATRHADFGGHVPAPDARQLVDWIADSGDNAGAGFFVVDKRDARLYAFDRDARLTATTAVLLGAASGDDTVPGIGTRPMELISVAERTTPAGRFVAQRGHNTGGEDVVWVDYDAAISMHRVRSSNPRERRLERLATPEVTDNRISYGCINVPAAFYDAHVGPRFAAATALVYVLPEVKPLHQVFGSYDVAPRIGSIINSADNSVRTAPVNSLQE
jgi:hypothetical protein